MGNCIRRIVKGYRGFNYDYSGCLKFRSRFYKKHSLCLYEDILTACHR